MKTGVAVNNAAWRPIRMNVAKQFCVAIFMAPLVSSAMDFSEAEKLITQYDPATRNYLRDRLINGGDSSPNEKQICDELPGGGVTQILRINQDGVIDLVVSNVQTQQSACFEKLYLGRAFKAPPTAPIYIKHKVGYSK